MRRFRVLLPFAAFLAFAILTLHVHLAAPLGHRRLAGGPRLPTPGRERAIPLPR